MASAFSLRRAALFPALVFGALSACQSTVDTPQPAYESDRVILDPVSELAVAVTHHEVATIDLGTPEARHYFLAGWGEDETDGERRFVWSLGEAAELEFFVVEPVDVTAVFACSKLAFDGAPAQIVTVRVNDRSIGEFEPGTSFDRYRLAIPRDALRPGMNRLRLAAAWHRAPAEVIPGALDQRALAVQWHSIDFEGLAAAESPRVAGADPAMPDRLELAAGSEVSYYLRAQPGDELVVSALAVRGDAADVSLKARFEAGDSTDEQVLDMDQDEPIRWPLPITTSGIARLTLTAARSGTGRGFGLGARDVPKLSLIYPAVVRPPESPVFEEAVAATPEGDPRRPPIIIYLIDALRADHLGAYGYDRPTSPHLDSFAEDGIVFTNAQAQSSWTRTAVTSLFTGLLPQVHGVNDRDDALAQPIYTMAEILDESGYRPLGLITNGNVSATFGLGQGFRQYRHLGESKRQISIHKLSHRVNHQLFEWLDSPDLPRDRPFFLYLHTTDPHAPYTPPKAFHERFAADVDPEVGYINHVREITLGRKPAPDGTREDWIDLYDGEIAFNDQQFGLLVDKLKSIDLYDPALIVVLSDHGEEFLDHGGWQHGRTLYGEQLRVPLIVKLPNGEAAGTRVDAVANQVDVLPTILDYLGVEPPSPLDGRSLLPLLGGHSEVPPSFAYLSLGEKRIQSVIANGWKLIVDQSPDLPRARRRLFHFGDDPGEARDQHRQFMLEAGFLHQSLRGVEIGLGRTSQSFDPEHAEMSEELRERLKTLGYIH